MNKKGLIFCTEAEFMNVHFLEFSGHNLESSVLEFSVWISLTTGKGVCFLSGFPPLSFTVYSN
jgi:hypothetical protein